MLKKLDPLLHNELRLAIMSLLISLRKADFPYLKEKTKATAGNLSVQVQKLKDAGYIAVEKGFKDNYPQTVCTITEKGILAFENYVNAIKGYLGSGLQPCSISFVISYYLLRGGVINEAFLHISSQNNWDVTPCSRGMSRSGQQNFFQGYSSTVY